MITTLTQSKAVQLVQIKGSIAEARDALDTLQASYDALKDELLQSYTDIIDTETATISKRTVNDVKVVEPKLVITWLKRSGVDYTSYMKLDIIGVKPLLKQAIKQGKNPSGTEQTTSETLVVTYKP